MNTASRDLTLQPEPDAPAATTPLAFSDVHRAYRGRQVLRGVSLTLEPGTTAALGGANGAGKTTMLRVAAGLVAPDAGEVRLHGLDARRDRRAYQRRLGFLAAGDRGLYPRLTTTQTLRMWAGLSMMSAADEDAALDAMRAQFGLEDLWRSRVDRLSLGQRQRVRLALTFMHSPDVVLLDEPHTSLDDAGLELLTQALEDLRARGGAALWCAPRADRVGITPDVAFVLEDGKVRAE
jgi:ABC-2 type transport system ATP-binding protein